MVPHHVECLGDPAAEGEFETTIGSGWCVGFNVFSTGQFSSTLGAIQQQVHTDPLGWFKPKVDTNLESEGDSGEWPQYPEFVLPMLQ